MVDWASDEEGGGYADRLPPGEHQVTIKRVVYENGEGHKFASKGGDPQILLVLADTDGREAITMLTLSDKAAWTIMRLLSACGYSKKDREDMNKDGVKVEDFATGAAEIYFTGQGLTIKVKHTIRKNREGIDQTYTDVEPIKVDGPKVKAPKAPGVVSSDGPAATQKFIKASETTEDMPW